MAAFARIFVQSQYSRRYRVISSFFQLSISKVRGQEIISGSEKVAEEVKWSACDPRRIVEKWLP
jgi:hypothetical protein